MLPLVLSSDSHVFEPPDLWQTRIDAPFRDRAPRIERITGADYAIRSEWAGGGRTDLETQHAKFWQGGRKEHNLGARYNRSEHEENSAPISDSPVGYSGARTV